MATFFEESLKELSLRNSEIEGTFKRIDANCFTAKIYRDGKSRSTCSIRNGGSSPFSGKGISYSADDRGHSNSYNEVLSIHVGDHSLSLKSMGMSSMMYGGEPNKKLTMNGAAEFYWDKLIEPLQRV